MAKLVSEDLDFVSYFELRAVNSPTLESSQKLQKYSWSICHGERKLQSANKANYLFFREPEDEVKLLADDLGYLVNHKKDKVRFEPNEPSIEIVLERPASDLEGLKVNIFIDEGNASTSISRWDSIGIRFFTTDDKLATFIKDLKREFNC